MIRIETPKYRTEDNNDIIIIVGLIDDYGKHIWKIEDIKYKTSRQREYRWYSHIFRDNWDYRHLDYDKRNEYVLNKFVEFVGEEKLKEALLTAYEILKPDLESLIIARP